MDLLDVVVGLDHLQRQQAAAAHAEADRADAPVVHRVDLGADLPARARPDVHDRLRATGLLGGHAQELRPPVELVHERQDLVLLARDHAADALGGPHDEHVPDVPGEVVVEVVQLVDGELVAQHVVLGDLLQHAALRARLHHLVALDPVGDGLHADEVAGVGQVLEAQAVVGFLVALLVVRPLALGGGHLGAPVASGVRGSVVGDDAADLVVGAVEADFAPVEGLRDLLEVASRRCCRRRSASRWSSGTRSSRTGSGTRARGFRGATRARRTS